MKKKRYEIIVIVVLFVISVSLLIGYVCSKSFDDKSEVNKYSADVSFTVQNSEDETTKSMVSYKYDGKSIVAKPEYLKGTMYVDRGIVYVAEGGRYKKFDRNDTYADVYDILYNLDFDKEDGNYNPKIEMSLANKLMNSLMIDTNIEKDIYVNISFGENRIRKFSLYLSDIKNFKKLNISIVFTKLEDDFENNLPIFYDEVVDEVEEAEFLIKDDTL